MLDQESLKHLWRVAFEQGRRETLSPGDLHAAMGNIVAVPIEARGRICGVLLAGFARADNGEEEFDVLEPYALLAGFAWDREAARQGQAALRNALRESEEHLAAELAAMQGKIFQNDKMAALGRLVSGVAHELNNPLTSIQGYAQLLLSRRSVSHRVCDARRIYEEAARAGRNCKESAAVLPGNRAGARGSQRRRGTHRGFTGL